MREPMGQINFGLEDDIYSSQVDQFLGKNDYDNISKPHNAFMYQLGCETALPHLGDYPK